MRVLHSGLGGEVGAFGGVSPSSGTISTLQAISPVPSLSLVSLQVCSLVTFSPIGLVPRYTQVGRAVLYRGDVTF